MLREILSDRSTRGFFLFAAIVAAVTALEQWLGLPSIDHDELEAIRWGAAHSWFVDKHPPLLGIVAINWAELTGFSTLGFFFLSKVNAIMALVILHLLNRQFLKPAAALVATAAYASTYSYFVMMSQMDANGILHALWPGLALALWLALTRRDWAGWIALGAVSGLAVLGKYHSLILIFTAFLLLLSHPGFRRQILTLRFAAALAVFALVLSPHIAAYLASDYSMIGYIMERGTSGDEGGLTGRLSGLSLLATQLAMGFFGLAILLWQLRRRLGATAGLLRPGRLGEPELFLAFIGLVFPLMPVVISLVTGITVLGSWGLNAWFLTPTLLIYICLKDQRVGAPDEAAPSPLRLPPYRVFLPVCLGLMALVILANNFGNVARPTPIPAEMQAIDAVWASHLSDAPALVVTDSRPGQGMAFYSRWRPQVAYGEDPSVFTWLLDANRCSKGPVLLIEDQTPAGAALLARRIAELGPADFQETVTTGPMRSRATMTSSLTLSVAGYGRALCFR
jgi:hypothetical protein